MASTTTNLKKVLEDVEKADHVLVRHILKAVIIQSPAWAETTERTLAADASSSEPPDQLLSDDEDCSDTNNIESPANGNKMKDGEATSLTEKPFCVLCRVKFDVPENERGIKRCVRHPGKLACPMVRNTQ